MRLSYVILIAIVAAATGAAISRSVHARTSVNRLTPTVPRTGLFHPSAAWWTRLPGRAPWLATTGRTLNALSTHPVVLLVLGSVIGSFVLPSILEQAAVSRSLADSRLAILNKHADEIVMIDELLFAAHDPMITYTFLVNTRGPSQWKRSPNEAPTKDEQLARVRSIASTAAGLFDKSYEAATTWTGRVEAELRLMKLIANDEMENEVRDALDRYRTSIRETRDDTAASLTRMTKALMQEDDGRLDPLAVDRLVSIVQQEQKERARFLAQANGMRFRAINDLVTALALGR